MNRQKNRQHRFLFGAIAVIQSRLRSLRLAVTGWVETSKAVKVSIAGGTQNPAAYGLTSSSLVPGTSDLATTYDDGRARFRLGARRRTDRKTDRSRVIATVLHLRQAERDRELTLLRIALRSSTSAEILG